MSGNTVEVIIGDYAYQPNGRRKSMVQRQPFYEAIRRVKPLDDLVIDPFNGNTRNIK